MWHSTFAFYIFRILKALLLRSPRWVAWGITGSSMATLWANVALTPVRSSYGT